MDAVQDILFYGGLNSDDALEMLPQGDYLDLENAKNYDKYNENKFGKVSKLKGTTKVENTKRLQTITKPVYNPATGLYVDTVYPVTNFTSKTYGTVKDSPNNVLYYFNYETYTYDGIKSIVYYTIYRFDDITKRITDCIVRTTLQIFDKNKKVKWGNVLNGFLTWTQDTIEPKGIWIEKAKNYTSNYFNNTNVTPAYQSMTMQDFNILRRPPVDVITATYETNTDVITNNIKGKLFQFRHKYVYNDNSESVWGMASIVPLPYGENDANGDFNDSYNYNYLLLSFLKPNPEIKEIWLASRYVDSDGILTTFSVFQKVNVSSFSAGDTITYDFYNDILGTPLSDNENSKLLDAIPLSAGTQEVVSNPDRIAYGNIKDPLWDNITPEVEVEVVSEDVLVVSENEFESVPVRYTAKTELAAYKIDNPVIGKPRLYLNGNGICTMIKFDDAWIANGAENIRIVLRAKIGGVQYTYSTNQINISGMTPTQIIDKIKSRVQTDYTNNGGTVKVAFDDYNSGGVNSFVVAINGGYANTSTAKWTGLEDYMFFGSSPTGYYIVLRTGLLIKNAGIPSGAVFPEASVKITTNLTTLDVQRHVGWTLGKYYIIGDLGTIVNNFGSVSAPDFYTGSDVFISVSDLAGYESRVIVSTSISTEYTQPQQDISGTYVRPTLTPFGKYGSAIVYYDENLRPCFAQKIEETFIERSNADYNKALVYNLRFAINHLAPTWAKYWTIVLTKNLLQESLTEVDLSIDTATPITQDADYIYIDVNTALNLWYKTYNNTTDVYRPYTFTTGDRVIIYDNVAKKYYDREIVAVDDDGKIMIQKGTLNSANIADVVRYYKPQVRYAEDLYFEVGQLYGFGDINNPNGKYHALIDSIQTDNNPLTFTLSFGDIYLNAINMYALKTGTGEVDSPTYNEFFMPFYQSKMNSFGRPHVANAKVDTSFKPARIRISNALNQESNTFGLTSFDSLDYTDLPEKHGKIQALIELGYTLKVVTETKLISIYVNRTVSVDPNGGEGGVFLVDKVLGTIRIPETSYGTIYPDAIVKTNRNLFFFDSYNGCFVMDSANGQIVISNYKYASYSKRLSKVINNNTGTFELFSLFNENEFHFAVNIVSGKFEGMPDSKGNILVFNDDLNRWTHHIKLQNSRNKCAEWGDNIGNDAIVFLDGELYILYTSDAYNTFFDRKADAEVKFVVNQEPKRIKIFKNISIHAVNLWHAEQNGDISIPSYISYPNGMSSRLKPARFRDRESIYYADFANNGLTSGMDYDTGIRTGQKLRGNLAIIRLRNSRINSSDLFSVSVKFNLSETSY